MAGRRAAHAGSRRVGRARPRTGRAGRVAIRGSQEAHPSRRPGVAELGSSMVWAAVGRGKGDTRCREPRDDWSERPRKRTLWRERRLQAESDSAGRRGRDGVRFGLPVEQRARVERHCDAAAQQEARHLADVQRAEVQSQGGIELGAQFSHSPCDPARGRRTVHGVDSSQVVDSRARHETLAQEQAVFFRHARYGADDGEPKEVEALAFQHIFFDGCADRALADRSAGKATGVTAEPAAACGNPAR